MVSACGRTHRGRVRAENQDRLLVADLGDGALRAYVAEESGRASTVGPLRLRLSDRGVFLLVADGMGGRAGGARASTLAVDAVRRSLVADADGVDPSHGGDGFVRGLRSALEHAHQDIREHAEGDDGLRGMGTTATLAGILGETVYLAHVGDSRAYLFRGDHLVRLTRDQSLAQHMIDSGVLGEQDSRSVRRNMILQALGVAASVDPVVTYHDLRQDDVILLCSDGLSHVVADTEILEALAQSPDCLSACDRLVGLANDRGGPDNVTVLVARLEGDGLDRAGATEALGAREWPSSAH